MSAPAPVSTAVRSRAYRHGPLPASYQPPATALMVAGLRARCRPPAPHRRSAGTRCSGTDSPPMPHSPPRGPVSPRCGGRTATSRNRACRTRIGSHGDPPSLAALDARCRRVRPDAPPLAIGGHPAPARTTRRRSPPDAAPGDPPAPRCRRRNRPQRSLPWCRTDARARAGTPERSWSGPRPATFAVPFPDENGWYRALRSQSFRWTPGQGAEFRHQAKDRSGEAVNDETLRELPKMTTRNGQRLTFGQILSVS